MEQDLLDTEFLIGIVVSVVCGFLIGLERQIKGKPVGIRTSILICFGTMVFLTLGAHVGGGVNVARVLGQVVTGVGFLGAGVIMTRNNAVAGMTSAAVVWLLAAVGASIGLHYYTMAFVVTFVALCVLVGVEKLENVYKGLRKGIHSKSDSM